MGIAMRRFTAALLLMLPLALAAARPAEAGSLLPPGPYSTWVFTGNCADCTGTGVGTLVLSDYTPGAALTTANFYSFTYASNLLTLSATYSNIGALSGVLGPGDGPFTVDFEVGNMSYVLEGNAGTAGTFAFRSRNFGPEQTYWYLGFPDADNGLTHSWSLSAEPVPEPATLALLGAGLVGLASVRRRRQAG